MKEQCEEVEQLEAKYDTFNMHKKIKEITGIKRKIQPNVLSDGENIILELKDKLKLWEAYITELFQDEERPQNNEQAVYETGPEILKEEVKEVIHQAKNGKTPGPDDIYTEVLKLISNNNLDLITRFFNNIYSSGHIHPQRMAQINVCDNTKKAKC